MDLEDSFPCFGPGHRNVHQPVKAPRSENCRVKDVRAVSCRNDPDVLPLVKAVHFRKELHERPLDFPVGAGGFIQTPGCNRVQFVYKYNTRGFFPGHFENFPDKLGTVPYVLLHKFRADYPDEGRFCPVSHSFCEQGLTCSRETEKKHSLGRFYPYAGKAFRVDKRQFYCFLKFLDLFL